MKYILLLIATLGLSACNHKIKKSDGKDISNPCVDNLSVNNEWCTDSIEILSDKDFSFKMEKKLPDTGLIRDLIDFYNSSIILNSIWSDFEVWIRNGYSIQEKIKRVDCSIISNDSIREYAHDYKEYILSILSNNTNPIADDSVSYNKAYTEYSTFKTILADKYHISKYGEFTREEYWKAYDKNRLIADYDYIYKLRGDSTTKTAKYLKGLVKKETNFDEKCIYALEYAHTNETSTVKVLEMLMNEKKYSIYLFEIWRTWRCLLQRKEGLSKDSNIPNSIYNTMKMICASTIINYILQYPPDLMAINQYLVLSFTDNIHRYGPYPYGNQSAMEEMLLFPERFDSKEAKR